MIRSNTITSLVILLFQVYPILSADFKFLHDCYVPLQNEPSKHLQCHTGLLLVPIPKTNFDFHQNFGSQKRTALTSFHITLDMISRKEYSRYLSYSEQLLKPVLKSMNGADLAKPIVGVNWQEARDYCRFFGMELPSEAQLEFALYETKELHKNELDWEFVKDSFALPQDLKVSNINPIYRSVSSYQTLRSNQDRGLRKKIQRHDRRPNIGFRCVSNQNSRLTKEILLNYTKNEPYPKYSESHFLKIDSIPSGASIFEDPQFHHFVGKTPFYASVDPGQSIYMLKTPKSKPKLLKIDKQKGKGQHLIVHFDEILPQIKQDSVRGNRMILIPSGRITIGNSEFDKAKVKNEMLQKHTEHSDLNDRTIRKYLSDEGSKRIVYLEDFYIDETEVTNQQYQQYVNQSGANPARCGQVADYNQNTQPVVCVNWIEANAFCKFYGMTLPTEIQYEKAARGTSPKQITAWIKRPQPVLTDQKDRSRYDVRDLSGNVMEWNEDWYDNRVHHRANGIFATKPYNLIKKEKVIKGASFASHRLDRRIAKRRHKSPEHYSLDLGFRCVQNL